MSGGRSTRVTGIVSPLGLTRLVVQPKAAAVSSRSPARARAELQDGEGLDAELGQGPVAVHPLTQIALHQTGGPETFGDVDQQAQVDAVAPDEGDRLQDRRDGTRIRRPAVGTARPVREKGSRSAVEP